MQLYRPVIVKLGLCMIVRDEARNIEACLGDVADSFDDIVVVDTGSRDETRRILKDTLGIESLTYPIDEPFSFDKYVARNLAFERVDADWILSLDADERIERSEIEKFRETLGREETDGYFTRWTTYNPGDEVEDYKLSVFRKGYRSTGLVHENVQQFMRQAGGRAGWTDFLHLRHYPDPGKLPFKRDFYKECLRRAIEIEPHWYRYHWFLGYACFRGRELEIAEHFLDIAASSRSLRFPVECLNAHLVLAALHAARNEQRQAKNLVCSGAEFLREVRQDFEVKVNFRFETWFADARDACAAGRYDRIKAYEFSA